MPAVPRLARLAAAAAVVPFALGTAAVHAQALSVQDPWVRATVAQQTATGMFARITAPAGGRLVGASSPVAGVVEIHEMTMDGNVMRMRAIAGLDLPAGKAVELRPGGHHVMLMDLKQTLKSGDTVPVTLVVEGPDRSRTAIDVQASVRSGAPSAASPDQGKHDHGKH
ncbi:MAG: copper chaperone PCu(A)C [Rubrivivax sp.]|jgi:hypothetical protein|nr:copper chaperone PCu(A)C [Rubrivivax sp.]